ncbi:M81 family metallopeptidase [uncultured Roseibium sp.]|uniref:M81 family metallopeptidase n=1 Tax=uncultured Roseibium sp. TaxID=1936171 RepID=UPI00262B2EB2|nr:M81 family metallopeptidase [uncultured Roseibium sp.]
MTQRRAFTAVLATETNTFSPIRIDIDAFEASLLARPGEHPGTPTLCSAVVTVGRQFAKDNDWQLVEGTSAWADPAGLVSRQCYELLRDEILGQLKKSGPFDVIVLGLHGAMVAAGYDDPEGDFLTRAREIVGSTVPIVATMDPHSHLTRKRITAADALIAFKEFPHTDFVERAEDAWHLAGETVAGRARPVISVFDPKMIDVFPTSKEPMRGFVDDMIELERGTPNILSLSVIHGFMAGDVPEMGTKILAVTNDDHPLGERVAKELGEKLYGLRGNVRSPELTPSEAFDKAVGSSGGPVTIADMWDNPGGGTAGDSTILLTEALKRQLTKTAFGSIWDPIAVKLCHAAGEGASLKLRFGAKSAPETGLPIDAEVDVIRNVKNATQVFGDSIVPIGDATWIKVGEIDVILNSTRAQCFDTSLFTNFGIDLADLKIVVVKSTNHFYRSFAEISQLILYCSAGRPYPNDPRKTPYKKAPSDIWPISDYALTLDEEAQETLKATGRSGGKS